MANKRIGFLKNFCPSCREEIGTTNYCKKFGKVSTKCPDVEKHVYRVVVYEPNSNKRRVKVLDTKNMNEAIKQAIEFREQVKTGKYNNNKINDEIKINKQEDKSRLTLMEAMTLYIAHLTGKRGPSHTLKVRSNHHIMDVKRSMVLFAKAIKKNGNNPESIDIVEANNQKNVGIYHDYLLKTMNYSNRTYNRYMGNMRSWLNYLKKQEDLDIKNSFNSVQKRKAVTDIKTIEPEQFKKLLDVISKENGEQILSTGEKKYHYHPFLKDAFMLGLLTGLRREELVSLRYSDIQEDGKVISSNNLKRNRIMNANETGDVKFTSVPVTPQLTKLLMKMGYEENKNSDKYILAPDSTIERKTLMNIISKAFSVFAKKAGLPSDISFRHLRKTFATEMHIVLGNNSHLATGHGSQKILNDHYINKSVIARVASNHDIFPELDVTGDERMEDIQKIRTKQKDKSNSIER